MRLILYTLWLCAKLLLLLVSDAHFWKECMRALEISVQNGQLPLTRGGAHRLTIPVRRQQLRGVQRC